MRRFLLLALMITSLNFAQEKNDLDFAARIGFIKEMKVKFNEEASLKIGNFKGNSLKFLNFSDEKILELKKTFKIQAEQLIQKYDAYSMTEKGKELDELANTMYINEIETRKLLDEKQLDQYVKNFDIIEKDKTKPINMLYLTVFISNEHLKKYELKQ